MKKISIVLASIVLAFSVGANECPKCNGCGVFEVSAPCPFCKFVVSNLFEGKKCQACAHMKQVGRIAWSCRCECKAGKSPEVDSMCASARARVRAKCVELGVSTKGVDERPAIFSLNIDRWMSTWKVSPSLFKRMLDEVVNNIFDRPHSTFEIN